ncbi:hypothetical protein Pfo_028344 [Paulownia fortunei]|nr:hypothetical protein Pfo_028344 [Paulownia fortunei]
MSEESYCTDCRRETVVVLDRASGDAVCTECGLVLESHFIDETAEWRNFADDKDDHDPNRVGAPVDPLLVDAALSTVVSNGPISGLSRRMDRRTDPVSGLSGGERHGYHAVVSDGHKISGLSWRLNRRNDPYQSIVSAFTTIAEMADRLSLLATIKRRFCCKLGMSNEEVRTVRQTIQKSEELDIRRSPISIAAAVIFMINQLSASKKSLREIADATTVAEGTIKNAFRDLQPYAQRILPESYVKGRDLKNIGCLKA